MTNNVKEFFDSVAPTYIHEDNAHIDELINSLNILHGMRILDLGAGKGIISERLQKLSQVEVIALDISSKMLEDAKHNISNPNIKFVNEDYYEYTGELFDMIVCFDAYPHFLDTKQFVEKSIELLKDNGILAIIHDCGREELNNHHKAQALGVSRQLKEPSEEVKPFLDNFKVIETNESNSHYKIILRKTK